MDLEYFGFDDPVKLITDFIWHPAMSLSASQKKFWVEESMNIFEKTPKIEARFLAAWPVIGLRWSLILLNEFLKEGWEKRVHARPELAELRKEKLEKQLIKAIIFLTRCSSWNCTYFVLKHIDLFISRRSIKIKYQVQLKIFFLNVC